MVDQYRPLVPVSLSLPQLALPGFTPVCSGPLAGAAELRQAHLTPRPVTSGTHHGSRTKRVVVEDVVEVAEAVIRVVGIHVVDVAEIAQSKPKVAVVHRRFFVIVEGCLR